MQERPIVFAYLHKLVLICVLGFTFVDVLFVYIERAQTEYKFAYALFP